MRRSLAWWSVAGFLAGSLMLAVGTAGAAQRPELIEELRDTIVKVRTRSLAPWTMTRTEAARRIESLTRRLAPTDVDDQTLSELISLLDTSDDSVRAWVAASLGNLGARARPVIPRLLAILPEVDCVPLAGLNSAGFVRMAISRMGVMPPPEPDCKAVKK
jgi:hypothetical protein